MNETVLTVLITSVTGVLTALITAVATAYTQINVERIKASVHDRPDDRGVGLPSEETSSKQVLTPGKAIQSVNWRITVLLTGVEVVIIATLLLLLLWPPSSNRLITRYDFEGTDDGWSRTACTEFAPDETEKSEYPRDLFFPGFMRSEVTTNYALTGQSSLKVTTSVNTAGDFKGFLRRKGTFMGYGATIYVMTPDLPNASIEYVQLCIPSHDWVCSDGTKIVPGEWTPITIDLSHSDENGDPLYGQILTEIAVQWRFRAEAGTSIDLYFDSTEIFFSGR